MKKHLLLIAIFIYTAFSIKAQIIHVPADHSTIQAGINAASDGDTVLVAEGTYYENVRFMGKAITLASEYIMDLDTTHIANTIIDGSQPEDPDMASVVMFIDGEDTTSILNGFTISGGTGIYEPALQGRLGGGVYSRNSSCKLINNLITNNHIEDNWMVAGGGIACNQLEGENWSILENNKLVNNSATTSGYSSLGGGIYISTQAIVKNNLITNNSSTNSTGLAVGGGIGILNGSGEIVNNKIEENAALSDDKIRGGGIYLQSVSGFSIEDNILTNNTLSGIIGQSQGRGAGIYTGLSSDIIIRKNLINSNRIQRCRSWNGSGMYLENSIGEIKIIENEIINNSGNLSSALGAGIYLLQNGENPIIIDKNLIKDHRASRGAGIYSYKTYNMILSNNLVINNLADNEGGGILLQQYEDDYGTGIINRTVIVNNTFIGNTAPLGGAIYTSHEITPIIFNSMFWDNHGSGAKDIYNLHNNVIAVFNNNVDTAGISGNWTGENNIYDNPSLMVDRLHLSSRSLCCDTGIDSLVYEGKTYYCPSFDIDGDERPFNGTLPDIGADEYTGMVGIFDKYLQNQNSLSIYPNPYTQSTRISYKLQKRSFVRLEIFNMNGQIIESLINKIQDFGEYQIILDLGRMPEGLYFCTLNTNQGTISKKIIKL